MDALGNLQLELHEAGARKIGLDWWTKDKIDNFSRVWFIETGSAFLRHHNRSFRLRAGWSYLIPAYSVVSFSCKQPFYAHWLHCNATVLGGPEIFNYVKCHYALKADDPDRILKTWRRLAHIASQREPALRLEARGIALQLIAPFILATEADRPSSLEFSRMRDVVTFVDAHIHERIAVTEMARAAHLERSYFSRVFMKYTGSRPSEYLKRRRIHIACESLMRGPVKFATLAASLGFADAFHFSRVFKKVVGVSPRQFRENPKLSP